MVELANSITSWPSAFAVVGIAFAIAIAFVGFWYCMSKW